MYTIDETYFVRELLVPNAVGNSMDRSGAQSNLTQYIDGMSRLVYKSSLGHTLFEEFDADTTDGLPNDTTEQRWIKLIQGVTYQYSGTTYRWQGMISEEGAFKTSLLAYYTFYKYLYKNDTVMTGTGNKVINTKNTIIVNNTQHLVDVWNQFVEMYRGDSSNITRNGIQYYYRGVLVCDYYSGNETEYVDLITFLEHNESDYPDAAKSLVINKEPIVFKNQLGL